MLNSTLKWLWPTLFLWAALRSNAAGLAQDQIDFFENKVRPLLVEQCYDCHSAKAEKLKGSLFLDSKEGISKGGASGPVLIAGKPEESLLIQVVKGTSQDVDQMPPAKAKKSPLSAQQVAILEQWVRMGAPDPRVGLAGAPSGGARAATHWAFQLPVAPPLPKVQHADWVRQDLDRFVLTAMEAKGVSPSPEADRRTLLRRISFDLTGLPPSDREVTEFIADTVPGAYERAVDRLLASPQYGERWARFWLDVARYADTKGYVFEEERRYAYSFTYRDWVVNALNRDLPYDEFLTQQIAGDKVAKGEDQSPCAALGFLTLGRRFLNNEPDIIDDRLDVVFRGTQGLTVGCARCHDHKFDPIPTADYYSLYGVFASSYEPGDKPTVGKNPNVIQVAAYEKEHEKRQKELLNFRAERTAEVLKKLRERVGDYLLTAQESLGLDWTNLEGLARTRSLDPGLVAAWRDRLEQWRGTSHPVFQPWFALASNTNADFAARAVALPEKLAKEAKQPPANQAIVKAVKEHPPANLKEFAELYAKSILDADKAWKQAEEDAIKAGTKAPVSLADADQESLRKILYAEDSPVNAAMKDIDRFFDTPTGQKIRSLKRSLEELDATHQGAPLRAMALFDKDQPIEPVVFKRGNPGNHGPSVPRQFLGVLSGTNRQPFKQGSGRLELAQAIACKTNPLTARVFVNRVWLHHLGAPLVRTPSDFGLRSEPPANPQLLDHLASWFMDHNWSIKELHRYILLSATYRQSSDPETVGVSATQLAVAEKVDPQNTLLWRMNRKRLDFEAVRDSVLQVSGQLDLTIGGRGVEMFEAEISPRRTIYGLVDRQNLPGLLRSFDFASPDATSPMRFQTTVPQQALFLMNGPFAVTTARRFAASVGMSKENELKTIQALYRAALQRPATPDELAASREFLAEESKRSPFVPPTSAWTYGTARFDEKSGKVTEFQAFKHFHDKQWQDGPVFPATGDRGYASLSAKAGHPGRSQGTAVVRRWTSSVDGVINISGQINHPGEAGDGVRGRVVSSRQGKLGEWAVHHEKSKTKLEAISVQRGEVIDFIVDCNKDDNTDSFEWAPDITLNSGAAGEAQAWSSARDFRDPDHIDQPLDPWSKLAQVLLASNEFVFED